MQYTTRAIERYFGEPKEEVPIGQERKRIPLRIQFAFDSAELSDQARQDLDEFGKALSGETLSGRPFIIEGHTDSVGSDEYNNDLSKRRADAAAAYLVSVHGVAATTLSTEAFGESTPRGDNSTDAGRRENRRVEFVEQ